jgi:pilus assembly protein CpaE
MKINVLLLSKLESNTNLIRSMISDEEIAVIGEATTGSGALNMIENLSPDIIIMTLGEFDTDTLSLAERIILQRPRAHVILLAESMNVEILQSAIRIGAHNVTGFPASQKEFGEYIKSVYHNETQRINSLNQNQSLSWMSRVVTVFGAKGGLGKTTLAVNLAVKLAENNKKVALVDLDLQFGDTHIFLDIDPTDTISELFQESSNFSIDSVKSYMTVHSCGIHVLCSPKSPEYAELISPEKIQSLLGLLRTYYDFVIIDTPPFFSDVTMTALESSSTILFVTGLDISILKNSKIGLNLLDSLQQTDKIRLIINRAVDMGSIKVSDVQKILGYPIWAKLPSDYKVAVTALNRGVPFVISSPGSTLSQSVGNVAGLLLHGESDTRLKDGIVQTEMKGKSRLGRLNLFKRSK